MTPLADLLRVTTRARMRRSTIGAWCEPLEARTLLSALSPDEPGAALPIIAEASLAAADATVIEYSGQATPAITDLQSSLAGYDAGTIRIEQVALGDRTGQAFYLERSGGLTVLRYTTQTSLENGVYTLLDHLGFRWYGPGEDWFIRPAQLNAESIPGEWREPTFRNRTFFGTGGLDAYAGGTYDPTNQYKTRWYDWKRRNRFNADFPARGHAGHAFYLENRALLDAHPEWFSSEAGKQAGRIKIEIPEAVAAYKAWIHRKYDNTAAAFESIGVDPEDGRGGSDDPLPPDGFAGITGWNHADKWWWLANEVAKDYPEENSRFVVTMYAYGDGSTNALVPKFPLRANVYPVIIPYAFQTAYLPKEMVTTWADTVGGTMGLYDYWNITQWSQGLPQFHLHGLKDKLEFWRANKVDGTYIETTDAAGPMGHAWWIAGQLQFDLSQDFQTVYNQYLVECFGAAAPAMKKMYDRWSLNPQGAGEVSLSLADLAEADAMAARGSPEWKRINELKAYVHFMKMYHEHDGTQASKDRIFHYLYSIHHLMMVQTAAFVGQWYISPLTNGNVVPQGNDAPLTDEQIDAQFRSDLQSNPKLYDVSTFQFDFDQAIYTQPIDNRSWRFGRNPTAYFVPKTTGTVSFDAGNEAGNVRMLVYTDEGTLIDEFVGPGNFDYTETIEGRTWHLKRYTLPVEAGKTYYVRFRGGFNRFKMNSGVVVYNAHNGDDFDNYQYPPQYFYVPNDLDEIIFEDGIARADGSFPTGAFYLPGGTVVRGTPVGIRNLWRVQVRPEWRGKVIAASFAHTVWSLKNIPGVLSMQRFDYDEALPVVSTLSDSPDPVLRGRNVTLTAGGVSDPYGSVSLVEFFRDANGNGVLDAGVDALLGTDDNGADGWSWTGTTAAFAIGTNRYFARARDNQGLYGDPATTTGAVAPVGQPPAIASMSASPSSVTRPGNVTLTANGVTDPSGLGVTQVTFYRDSTTAGTPGVWDPADTLLGADTNGADGWKWTGSSLAFPTGANRYFARALGASGQLSNTVTATNTVANARPSVGSLTDSPDPLIRGQALTLTAGKVSDADGTVTKVEFWRDANNNGAIDTATDLFLGLGSFAAAAGQWSLTVSGATTAAFPLGGIRYLARAQDQEGVWSNARSATGTVNVPPTIMGLAASPNPVSRGDNLTLTAGGLSDAAPGSVTGVYFYRDSNNSGAWESTDKRLGTANASSNWAWTGSTSDFPLGAVRLFARAVDNNGAFSLVAATATVQVNAKASIGSLTDSPDPLIQGLPLTLRASSVTHATGSVTRLEFFRDLNGNSRVDPGIDQFLGGDDNGADGWTVVVSGVVTAGFPLGSNRYLARAFDSHGSWSPAKSATGLVNLAPVVTSLTASPNPVHKGDALTLTAGGVSDPNGSVASVEFYYDSNGSGAWESTDSRIATDSSSAGGWSVSVSTSNYAAGVKRFFARAKDNNGSFSLAAATTTVLINAKPTISSLAVSPTSVVQGGPVTVTASGVSDADGSVARVEIYRDLDANGLLDATTDQLLGVATNVAGTSNWRLSLAAAGFPIGSVRLLARAQDNLGAWSAPKSATLTVNAPATLDALILGLDRD